MERKPIPSRRIVSRKAATLRAPLGLRASVRAPERRSPSLPVPTPPAERLSAADSRPSPYLDYSRRYTAEGSIAITYKDIDDRFRWTVLRCALWSAAMSLTGWYALTASPLPLWVNLPALILMGVVYWLIVRKPIEVYRKVEVRLDCLIVEDDVFYREEMETWPSFQPDAEGNLVLTGILGTRWVEYLKVPRFDEFDRAPEVFANHLRAAMQQLWSYPSRGLG